MRVISQNWTIDCPYEASVLRLEKTEDKYHIKCMNQKIVFNMATYTDKDSADIAMIGCCKKFLEGEQYYWFPMEGEIGNENQSNSIRKQGELLHH